MSSGSGATPPLPPVPNTSSNCSLLQLFLQDNNSSPNYLDWIHNLRITFRYEKEYVLDEYLVEELLDDSTKEEAAKREKHHYHSIEVLCLLLVIMSFELQKGCQNIGAYNLNELLK